MTSSQPQLRGGKPEGCLHKHSKDQDPSEGPGDSAVSPYRVTQQLSQVVLLLRHSGGERCGGNQWPGEGRDHGATEEAHAEPGSGPKASRWIASRMELVRVCPHNF